MTLEHMRKALADHATAHPLIASTLRTIIWRQFAFQFKLRSLAIILFTPNSITKEIHKNLLFNRDPRLTEFADKIASKAIASEHGIRTPKTMQVWASAEEIKIDSIPRNSVLKATHGSGMAVFVSESIERGLELDPKSHLQYQRIHPDDLDLTGLRELVRGWLSTKYGAELAKVPEWAYQGIEPTVIAEELLGDGILAPIDYRFICVRGRVKFVAIAENRFIELRMSHLDRDFRPLEMSWSTVPEKQSDRAIEISLSVLRIMRDLAEKISRNQRFLRVDFYYFEEEIYLGELTNYPFAGWGRFSPRRFDRELMRQ